MLAEWSVECSPDDPVLVVPWSDPSDPSGNRRFIDLRENPYDLDHIPEAEHYPPLMQALRALNAPRSLFFTAKCDAWILGPETENQDELEALRINLDEPAEDAPHGLASYIDILARDRSLFASFHRNEMLLQRITRRAEPLDHPYAMLDCVLRPALVDISGPPQEGYAISVYLKALGQDHQSTMETWAAALEATVALLRGKDLI